MIQGPRPGHPGAHARVRTWPWCRPRDAGAIAVSQPGFPVARLLHRDPRSASPPGAIPLGRLPWSPVSVNGHRTACLAHIQ